MKALSLTQPYATLIALGKKPIETRSWATLYRGELAIHASKYKSNADIHATVMRDVFFKALQNESGGLVAIPSGAIVAVCNLVGCTRTDEIMKVHNLGIPEQTLSYEDLSFGDFSSGRYGWFVADVRQLREPIPAKGALGLWEWQPPDNLQELLLEKAG